MTISDASALVVVGDSASDLCTSVTPELPKECQIGANAFDGCASLTWVSLPRRLSRIEHHTFHGCAKLAAIEIPDGVNQIARSAFEGCSSLTSVTIPDGVDKIGHSAFERCEWLIVVTLPTSVRLASSRCFRGCSRLSLVIAPPHETTHFDDCPLLTRLVANSEHSQRRALQLQFWSVSTQHLCSEPRQAWVVMVLLVAARLRQVDLPLPPMPNEMWFLILEFVPRWALGSLN